MNHLKSYIDRVSATERRGGRDIVLTLDEARSLRDEIAKLLIELHNVGNQKSDAINVELVGSRW